MAVERFSAIVGANIRKFTRSMREVHRELAKTATGAEADIKANVKEFQRKIQKVKRDLDSLDDLSADPKVSVEIGEFRRRVVEIERATNAIDRLSPEIDINILLAEFRRKMIKIRKDLQRLKLYRSSIEIDADLSRFERAMKYLKARMMAINGQTIWVYIKTRYREFQQDMGRVATQMRNWGEIFGTQLMGSLIMLIPTLSPIISSLIGLIGSLGVMIGVVAGSTFALATALGAAGAAAVAFGAVAIPTITKLFDENAKLTNQQKAAKKAFDDFKTTYDEIVKETEKPVLEAFTKGMQTAKSILEQLKPLFVSSAEAVSRLMSALQQSVNTKPIQDFFAFLNKDGASLLETLSKAVGNLIKGLMSMMTAFGPLAKETANGFLAMTQRFAEWAEGLKTSKSFQEFVNYVREHMPIIRKIFGDTFIGIIGFFTSFSGIASQFMYGLADMMARFREWATTLGENQQFQQFLSYIQQSAPKVIELLGNIWNFLVNLGIAMAPIGDRILDIVNSFLQWINSMMETHNWFSKLIGMIPVLIGGFMMFMAPIVGLKSIFGGPLLVALRNIIPAFKNVGTIISKVIPFVTNLASRALPLLIRGFGLLTGPVGIAITIITTLIAVGVGLYKNWDKISETASRVWNAVTGFISDAVKNGIKFVTNLKDEVSNKFNQLKESAITAAKLLVRGLVERWIESNKDAIKWLGELILTVINKFIEIKDAVIQKMQEVKQGIQNKWNEAVSFLKGINLVQIGKDIINGLISGITSMFSKVASSLSKLTDKIPSWVKQALKIHSPSRVMAAIGKWIPAGLAKGILENLGILKSSSNKMAEAVAPDFSKTIKLTEEMQKAIQRQVSQSRKKSLEEQFKDLEELARRQKEYYNWTSAQEAAYWRYAATAFKEGTAAKRWALERFNDAYERVLQDQFEAEKSYIEERKKFNKMSLFEELMAYEQYIKNYKEGSEQRKYYEEQVYNTKKEIHEKLKSLSEDYLAKVQDINQRLIEEEQALRDEYRKTYEDRVNQIKSFAGIFDKFEGTNMEGVNLLENLRGQVNALRGWMQNLSELEMRGLNQDLIAELRELGVNAANEIEALTKMSRSELNEFESLWKQKTELARIQATKELSGLREETEHQISQLRVNAVKELEQLRVNFEKEIREIRYGAQDELNFLTATLPQIGANAIQGFLNGIKSMESPLIMKVQSIAESIKRTMQQALDIHSPSRWFRDFIGKNIVLGTINGIESLKSKAIEASNKLAQWLQLDTTNLQTAFSTNISTGTFNIDLPDDNAPQQPINIHIHNDFDGEKFITYVDRRQSDDYDIRVYTNGG